MSELKKVLILKLGEIGGAMTLKSGNGILVFRNGVCFMPVMGNSPLLNGKIL